MSLTNILKCFYTIVVAASEMDHPMTKVVAACKLSKLFYSLDPYSNTLSADIAGK